MSYQVECPNNTYMCYRNLVKIMENIKKQQDENIDPKQCNPIFNKYNSINSCEKIKNSGEKSDNKCNNCDYLFENLIKGNITCKNLFDGLNDMTPDQLKTQIKYNLYQLVHMKAKVQPTRIYSFVDWWKQNIWGANKIQNYIYLVSALIAFIMFLYFVFVFLQQVRKDDSMKWVIFTIVVALVVIIVMMVYTFQEIKYKAPLLDPRVSVDDSRKYNKKVQENWKGESSGALKLGPSLFTILIGLYLFLVIRKQFFDDKLGFLSDLIKYMIAGFVIALNLFYVFFIPQFIIVGIILQRILTTGKLNKFNIVLGILILASILALSITETTAEVLRQKKENIIDPKNNLCTTEQNPNIGWQYWFIFITLFLITIGNYLIKDGKLTKFKSFSETKWALYLQPFLTFIS